MIGSVKKRNGSAPNVIYQTYTMQASVEGCPISLAYALLPDKKESTKDRLLIILKDESPKLALTDF